MSGHNGNGRYVTPRSEPLYHEHDAYWLGRLSMAVAVAHKAPESAREALDEFLSSAKPSTELKNMLREELKRK